MKILKILSRGGGEILPYLIVLSLLTGFHSCNKKDINQDLINAITPNLLINQNFPNGVLSFNTMEDLKLFYIKATKDENYVKSIYPDFVTLEDYFQEYEKEFITPKREVTNSNTNSGYKNVTAREYDYDLKSSILKDESLSKVLNPDMQMMVKDTLYQFTRIGLYKAEKNSIDKFQNYYKRNEKDIKLNAEFDGAKEEVPLSENKFLVEKGITRELGTTNNFLQKRPIYLDDKGGFNGYGYQLPPDEKYMVNYTLTNDEFKTSSSDLGFVNKKRKFAIKFKDFANRRLVFKVENFSFFKFINKLSLKAKVQKRKRFLFVKYWGRSWADELIIGCDNMNLSTDFIFPHPQEYWNYPKPKFDGVAKFKLGNHTLDVFRIKVNKTVMGYTLNNDLLASWLDGGFNSFVGDQYNNLFKLIEKKVINELDPSYLQVRKDKTVFIESVNDEHRLKFAVGKVEKKQGYSRKNSWTIDWNAGFSFKINGGVGGQKLSYTYKYDVKSASFFCKAKLGTYWHGIRVIILPK